MSPLWGSIWFWITRRALLLSSSSTWQLRARLWRLSANIESIILLSRNWVGTFHLDGSVRASRHTRPPPRRGRFQRYSIMSGIFDFATKFVVSLADAKREA